MTDWFLDHGVRVAFLLALGVVLAWLARRSIPRAVRLAVARDQAEIEIEGTVALEERAKRVETLSHVLVRTADIAIVVVVFFLVLGEVGFELAPLIAGAGIIGIAVGFGAQSIVRDVVSGVFILLENQYGKGDVVNVAGIGGVVEAINLRRTVLRDLDGVVHTIPNGEITVASNLTRGWSRVNVDVSIGYGEDVDRAIAVIDRVGEELAADSEYGPLILEPPKVLRVEALGDSGVVLKVLGTTKPIEQWGVAGQLRKRIKAAFDAEGIEIPFPHRTVVVRGDDSGSALLQSAQRRGVEQSGSSPGS